MTFSETLRETFLVEFILIFSELSQRYLYDSSFGISQTVPVGLPVMTFCRCTLVVWQVARPGCRCTPGTRVSMSPLYPQVHWIFPFGYASSPSSGGVGWGQKTPNPIRTRKLSLRGPGDCCGGGHTAHRTNAKKN